MAHMTRPKYMNQRTLNAISLKPLDDQLEVSEIVDRIKARRLELKATQVIVAECACVLAQTFNNLEAGAHKFAKVDVILRIMESLGLALFADGKEMPDQDTLVSAIKAKLKTLPGPIGRYLGHDAGNQITLWTRGDTKPSMSVVLRYLGRLGIRATMERKNA